MNLDSHWASKLVLLQAHPPVFPETYMQPCSAFLESEGELAFTDDCSSQQSLGGSCLATSGLIAHCHLKLYGIFKGSGMY